MLNDTNLKAERNLVLGKRRPFTMPAGAPYHQKYGVLLPVRGDASGKSCHST